MNVFGYRARSGPFTDLKKGVIYLIVIFFMFNEYSVFYLDFENVLLDLKGCTIILVPLTPNMITGESKVSVL